MEQGYGLPLRCPVCYLRSRAFVVVHHDRVVGSHMRPEGVYFGMLKHPGTKTVPCPNCGSSLVAVRHRRRREEAA